MTPTGDGTYALDVPQAGHGTDYAFSLDGGEPLPDPRSAWQPAGVHGPSRVFDPSRYAWSDAGWQGRDVLGALVYELHVGTFTPQGTLDAAVEKLDHLLDLGVEVVEIMPVAAFDGRWGWGYDGVDLYAVHDPYGGPEALQDFVDACHRRGLAVCLDVVYNHLGPSGNYLGSFGPYFTGKHDTPWGDAVNLDDTGSEHVRRWIIDNALRWFEDFHIDALRLDAVHALVDDSPRHLLAQLSDETAALAARLGRPMTLIAESDLNDPVTVLPTPEGWGLDAQWSDDFHHAVHATLTGEAQGYYVDFAGLDLVARTLTHVFRHAGDYSAFRGRDWGRPVDLAAVRGRQFLAYLQNHDQVGNRAFGDRHPATLPPGRLAVGAALLLTSPFTPMLFMGEEWAASTPWLYFTDFPDASLGAAVSAGRRAEFSRHGWNSQDVPDPQDPLTWRRSLLRWDERDGGDHARLLAWYRALIALRRSEPDLVDDDLRRVRVDHGEAWLTVRRGRIVVVVNLGAGVHRIAVPGRLGSDVEILLSCGEVELSITADAAEAVLSPDSVAVLRAG